jgi:hypothetical protein
VEIIESEVNIYHVTSRTVRRAFLMGDDYISGQSYAPRRTWIQRRLSRYAPHFMIDIISFCIMANHLHLVVRNRPDLVKAMSDEEVIRAWWAISPKCRNRDGSPANISPKRLAELLLNKEHIRKCRERLSSISWFMRYIKHPVAVWANAEDQRTGHFFEGRFRVTHIETLEQLLNTILYNDLNPIRAGFARSMIDSDHTSGQLRYRAAQCRRELGVDYMPVDAREFLDRAVQHELNAALDSWLSPIELREDEPLLEVPSEAKRLGEPEWDKHKPLSPRSASGLRASDRGVLMISEAKYLELLEMMARREAAGRQGEIPQEMPPILAKLGIGDAAQWLAGYEDFVEEIQKIYQTKVNDDDEANMVKLPLIDPTKTNQDGML